MMSWGVQKEILSWNKEAAEKIVPRLNVELIRWLAQQAVEDKWPKEAVGRVLCGKDAKNRVLFEKLDTETQKQVAVFDKARTCRAIPYLVQGDLLQWLHQEAVAGRWEKSMVDKFSGIKSGK